MGLGPHLAKLIPGRQEPSVNAKQAGSGATPLNTAAMFGQIGMAKLLMERGADVSIANLDGNTALHIASFFAHEDLVELLLEKGASVSAKNGRGETPLDVVSANWTPQLERLYESIGEIVGIELDLASIKRTRPKISQLLRQQATKDAGESPGSTIPSSLSIKSMHTGDDIAAESLAQARSQLHTAVGQEMGRRGRESWNG